MLCVFFLFLLVTRQHMFSPRPLVHVPSLSVSPSLVWLIFTNLKLAGGYQQTYTLALRCMKIIFPPCMMRMRAHSNSLCVTACDHTLLLSLLDLWLDYITTSVT